MTNEQPTTQQDENAISVTANIGEADVKSQSDGQNQNQIIAERRAKLNAIREKGVAFPNDFERKNLAGHLIAEFGEKTHDELEAAQIQVAVAGRMMLKRVMGKASFATIQDMSGRIQLFVSNDNTGEEAHAEFKRYDLGDILGAQGVLFKTKTGELSVRVTQIRLLTKALRPLPEKFHGLTDQEQKYRQRYVDLITNEQTRNTFLIRSKIVQAIREFFARHDYLEVETPMMHVIPGGASAKPFITHHNALDMPLYLRIAPELYLKRLVVGGFEKVFEINRNFRNEGLSTRHNPEFTMIEFYEAYRDYRYLMDFTEKLFVEVARKVLGTTVISYQGKPLDLGKPFHRLTMVQAVQKYHPQFTDAQLNDRDFIINELQDLKAKYRPEDGIGGLQLSLFEELAESHLFEPTFIIDYPVETSPLARVRRAPHHHRALRAVHRRARDRQRLLRAERPGGPGATLRRAGRGQGSRRRGGDVQGCRLRARAGIWPAADGGRRHRHRPAGDAAD